MNLPFGAELQDQLPLVGSFLRARARPQSVGFRPSAWRT